MPTASTAPAATLGDDRLATALETLAKSNTAALETIAQSNAAILANQTRKRLTFADLVARRPKREMPCVVYQNGMRLDESMLTDEALALLPKLRKGKFFGRLVTVHQDTGHDDMPWSINYPCQTLEQRIALANAVRGDFTEMLRRLTTDEPIID